MKIVRRGLWEVKVNDVIDPWKIKTTRTKICAN